MGSLIIPLSPFKNGGNCKELLLKSPFETGGFRGFKNLQTKGFMANATTKENRACRKKRKKLF
jgi:hypothetical protein